MKVTYSTKNDRLKVEIEAPSAKDVFKKLSEFQEIFDENNCGACGSESIFFNVRTVDNNDYYELKCRGCFARLAFGQHKNGGSLFPKRKKEDGTFDKENKGWNKWTPNNQ